MRIIALSNDNSFGETINNLINDGDVKYDFCCVSYDDFLKNNIVSDVKSNRNVVCLLDKKLGKDRLLSCLDEFGEKLTYMICDTDDKKYLALLAEGIKKYCTYARKEDVKLYIKTFGQFDVYNHGKLIDFKRSKTKELLAILVDNKGSVVTPEGIADLLYEDGIYDRKRQKELHVYISDLRKTLEINGFNNILLKSSLGYSVNLDEVYCDYYELLGGDKKVSRFYDGRYMYQYSWADTTNAYIERLVRKEDSNLSRGGLY